MTAEAEGQPRHHRISGWMAANNLSTWLLIVVLVVTALIVRPQLLNFIVYAVIAALLFIIRDVSRMEGRAGGAVFQQATWVAILVITLVIMVMAFGVRYVAI
jgi:energy-coupling factor transporter transmembrane protein EcfT